MSWENPKTNWGQSGQTVPIADDFNRIEENIRILGEYNRAPGYGTATGTNAKTITLEPAPTSYYDGLCFAFKNATQNTGAVTINVNGLGARPIKKPNGNDITAGNLKANSVYTVRYNGTNFILQGEGGEYGNVTPDDVIKGVTFGTEEGLKTGTLELTGNAAAADVLSGKTFYSTNPKSKLTGSMTNRGAVNQTLTTQGGSYTIPSGYHNGSGKVTASFSNLSAGNVKKGVNIGGVVGKLVPLPANSIALGDIRANTMPSSTSDLNLVTDEVSLGTVAANGTLEIPNVILATIRASFTFNDGMTLTSASEFYVRRPTTSWGEWVKTSSYAIPNSNAEVMVIYNPTGSTITLKNRNSSQKFTLGRIIMNV
jgi:hypothetical protein